MNAGATFSTVNSFDLDHYRAQPGNWNVQADQLSRGTFSSQIRSLQFEDLIVYDNRWGAASLIRGESPEGWIMFGGIIRSKEIPISWCGQQVDEQLYACTPEKQPIEFALAEGAHDIVILIKPELLAKIAGDTALEKIRRAGLVNFRHRGPQLLQIVMRNLLRLEQCPDLITRAVISADVKSELLAIMELCFRPMNSLDAWTLPRNRREEAVHAALREVVRNGGQTTALKMSDAAGISQRTLEIAFTHMVGVTPGRYLKLYRLNRSHRALARSEADATSVTDIALSLGFTHLGRFASDYRKLFGELPSVTLAS